MDAEDLFKGYYVDETIMLLEKDSDLINDVIQNKITEYKNYKSNYALMSRIEMGGYSYEKYENYITNNLFDVRVKDPYRPTIYRN